MSIGSWVAMRAVTPSRRTIGPEQGHDRAAGARVELACRLVGEEQVRAIGERPRDGDPLLLAAGQLVRSVARAIGQTDDIEESRDALLPLAHVG